MLLRRIACEVCRQVAALAKRVSLDGPAPRPRWVACKQGGFMLIGRRRLPGGPSFDPTRDFFDPAETGDWWDPSDLSMMYQDSAGTTAAAVNQPVGLMLGQRYKGQRGVELVTNGGFDDATGWTLSAGASIGSGVLSVATALTIDVATSTIGANANKWLEVTVDATVTSGTYRVIASGTVVLATSATAGQRRAIVQVSGSETTVRIRAEGGFTGTFDNISVREVPGIHRYQTTSANRPTLKQDANGKYYLSYNGTNSWMQTSAVDFSGTDKIVVGSMVTKLADADGAIAELSTTSTSNDGTFMLSSPLLASGNFFWRSRGTGNGQLFAGSAAIPFSAVALGQGDIPGDSASLRVNGAQIGASGTDQGTGKYGASFPIYFGARGGISLFLNGNEYCTLVCGAAKTESLVARLERFLAAKGGISL